MLPSDDRAIVTGVDHAALTLGTTCGPAFVDDPYATFAAARAAGPVHPDSTGSGWFVVADDELGQVLRDPTHVKEPTKARDHPFTTALLGGRSLLFMDDPDHARLRSSISGPLAPRAVATLEPRIQELVDALLDPIDDGSEWDLMAALAIPLPLLVIIELLGLDPDDLGTLRAWAHDNAASLDPYLSPEDRARVDRSTQTLDEHLRAAIAAQRACPTDSLTSALVVGRDMDGRPLSDDDIATLLGILVVAGSVTTTDLIGNAMYALLEQPDQWQLLCQRPELASAAVEEALRYDPPALLTSRIAARDQIIGGCPIRQGDWIWAAIASGNRDPAAHRDPDRFDVLRGDTHHRSFGGGAHFCPGAPLARLEAAVALRTAARRFPRLALADRGEAPTRKTMWSFRGLQHLSVVSAP